MVMIRTVEERIQQQLGFLVMQLQVKDMQLEQAQAEIERLNKLLPEAESLNAA